MFFNTKLIGIIEGANSNAVHYRVVMLKRLGEKNKDWTKSSMETMDRCEQQQKTHTKNMSFPHGKTTTTTHNNHEQYNNVYERNTEWIQEKSEKKIIETDLTESVSFFHICSNDWLYFVSFF